MTAERTPQELAQKLLDEYRAFGAGYAGISITPELLGQLCTALTAALDAREEMRRDVVEWFAAKNDKANGAPHWADRLFEAEDALIRIAQATPTGVSLRAELAEAKAEVARALGWDKAEPWFAAVAQIHGQRDELAEAQAEAERHKARYGDISQERERQKLLFPGASVSDDIGDLTRLMVLTEETGEVAKAVRNTLYPRRDPPNLREELVQVAAVCVGWLEWIDAALTDAATPETGCVCGDPACEHVHIFDYANFDDRLKSCQQCGLVEPTPETEQAP